MTKQPNQNRRRLFIAVAAVFLTIVAVGTVATVTGHSSGVALSASPKPTVAHTRLAPSHSAYKIEAWRYRNSRGQKTINLAQPYKPAKQRWASIGLAWRPDHGVVIGLRGIVSGIRKYFSTQRVAAPLPTQGIGDPIDTHRALHFVCAIGPHGVPHFVDSKRATSVCVLTLAQGSPPSYGVYGFLKNPDTTKTGLIHVKRYGRATAPSGATPITSSLTHSIASTSATASESARTRHMVWCNNRNGSPFPGRRNHRKCRFQFDKVHFSSGLDVPGARIDGAPVVLRPTTKLEHGYRRVRVFGGQKITCHLRGGKLHLGAGTNPLLCVYGIRTGDGRTEVYIERHAQLSWLQFVQLTSTKSIRSVVKIPWVPPAGHQVVAA